MSTYFYGCCHDCKVFMEAGNSSLGIAEEITRFWAYLHGHKGHKIQTGSEYDDDLLEGFYIDKSPYDNVTHEKESLAKRTDV